MNGHRLAEERSLELQRETARQIECDPARFPLARRHLAVAAGRGIAGRQRLEQRSAETELDPRVPALVAARVARIFG